MKRWHLAMVSLREDTPDRRTSLADLRAALCLECGVGIVDIDPASGFNYSRTAYEDVRASWRRELADNPGSSWLERHYAEARANWLAHRPDWDDDWMAPELASLPEPEPSVIPLFELEASR